MEAAQNAGLDLKNLQGNLVGFNKDHQKFLFLQFTDAAAGRAFLGALEPNVATGHEVQHFNILFREIHDRRGGASAIIQACWTNVGLSHAGFEFLGVALEGFSDEFRTGMSARAEQIGDKEDSAPANWVPPFNAPDTVHAIVILAADEEGDLQVAIERVQGFAGDHSVNIVGDQDGVVRSDAARGHEHFGFKDGISQPLVEGVTHSKDGSTPVPAGEFIVGYPNQDGAVSGEPSQLPAEGQPGYNPTAPPPPPQPMPAWTKDGSFLVFRRLRQDVAAFDQFVTETAAAQAMTSALLGAKLMGRWKSGIPLEPVDGGERPAAPPDEDPAVADPDSPLLKDRKINRFSYDEDPDGVFVPRAAHIRKTNPRGSQPGGVEETNRHRILRRGIPYGPEFAEGEAPYPGAGAPPPDEQDRGLLFLCYQASIARGFEFIQSSWANANDFPQVGDGRDPIISQDMAPRDFHLTPQGVNLTSERWVQTTGGEYFFSPSISALKAIAASEI